MHLKYNCTQNKWENMTSCNHVKIFFLLLFHVIIAYNKLWCFFHMSNIITLYLEDSQTENRSSIKFYNYDDNSFEAFIGSTISKSFLCRFNRSTSTLFNYFDICEESCTIHTLRGFVYHLLKKHGI